MKDIPIKDVETIELIKTTYNKEGNYRDLLFFLLAINTGLKINEILSLNIKDVKGKDSIIVKQCNLQIRKRIPLNEEIQELIKQVIVGKKNDNPLFTSVQGNRLDRTCVYKNFKDICDKLGLNEKFSISSLRKTFGYHYYQKYKDLSFLQWLFNQTTVNATMNYIDIYEDLNHRFNKEFNL